MAATPSGNTQQTVVQTAIGSGTTRLMQEFLTPQLGFAVIPGGSQQFHFHLLKDANANDFEAYATLELANSAGVGYGTILTSGPALITWLDASTPVEVTTDITLPTTTINPTDRMIVKIYVTNIGSGSHPVTFYTEGSQFYSFVVTSVGVVGNKGETGAQGAQGSAGTNGAQGAEGAQGSTGAQGATGTGAQGAQGIAGAQGATGTSGGSGLSIMNLTPTTPITGTTLETIYQTILIPANSVQPGRLYNLNWRAASIKNVSATTSLRVYLNTSPVVSGALNLLGGSAITLTTTENFTSGSRQFYVSPNLIGGLYRTNIMPNASSNNVDWVDNAVVLGDTYLAATIDWTVDQYFIFTAQLGNSTNDAYSYGYAFYEPNGSVGAQGAPGTPVQTLLSLPPVASSNTNPTTSWKTWVATTGYGRTPVAISDTSARWSVFPMKEGDQIRELQFYVDTAVAAADCWIGIYRLGTDANGNLIMTDFLKGATAIDASTTGVKTITFATPFTMAAETYGAIGIVIGTDTSGVNISNWTDPIWSGNGGNDIGLSGIFYRANSLGVSASTGPTASLAASTYITDTNGALYVFIR